MRNNPGANCQEEGKHEPVPSQDSIRVRTAPHALEQSWPAFLDEIDSSPERAMEGFYVFLVKLLESRPPSILRSQAHEKRQDFYHELFLHCCDNDFARLRRYQDRGRSFASWLLTLAAHLAIDLGRIVTEVPVENPEDFDRGYTTKPADTFQDQRVRECLDALGDPCGALLLAWAIEEMSLDELRILLGYPPGAASEKKAWDQVHKKCKPKLLKCLKSKGIVTHVA
jgi:DNA-directed RNA polymerase specialized sigma24 family protein